MNNPPTVAVLIAVHNRLQSTIICLDSLKAAAQTSELKILLIDDGSRDGTSEWLAANAPEVAVLKGDGNLWFGGALQKGLDHIKASLPDVDYVLFINNDTVACPGCIDALVAESRDDAAVSVLLLDGRLSRVHCFGSFWHWWNGWIYPAHGWLLSERPELREGVSLTAQMLSTACTLVPLKWLRKIKGIDVRHYPQHKADTNLFSQLSKAGAPLRVTSLAMATNDDDPGLKRYSCRDKSLSVFLKDSLLDKFCPMHFPTIIRSIWESAPARWQAFPVILRAALMYGRQILACAVLSALRRSGLKKRRSRDHHPVRDG